MGIIGGISAHYAATLDQFYAKIFMFVSITAFILVIIAAIEFIKIKSLGIIAWYIVAPLAIFILSWFGVMHGKFTEYQEEEPFIYGCTASLTNVSATTTDINININIWNKRSTEVGIDNISCRVYYQWWEGGDTTEIGFETLSVNTEIAAREYGSVAVHVSAPTEAAEDIYQHLIRRAEESIWISIDGYIYFNISDNPVLIPFNGGYEFKRPGQNYGEGKLWNDLIAQVPTAFKQPTAHMIIDGIQIMDINSVQVDCSLYGINPFSSEITLEKVGCDFYYMIDPDYTGGSEWLYLGYGEEQIDASIIVRQPNQIYSPINVIFTVQLDETEGTSLVQQLYSLEEDKRYLHIRLGGEGTLWYSGFEPVPFYPYVSSDYVH
jgi:LEA14-like dessication related protein